MRHGRCTAVRRTTETDPEDIIGLIMGAPQMRSLEQTREVARSESVSTST
jgi:hypothetical protein